MEEGIVDVVCSLENYARELDNIKEDLLEVITEAESNNEKFIPLQVIKRIYGSYF